MADAGSLRRRARDLPDPDEGVAEPEQAPPVSDSPAPFAGSRVLIVDDDATSRWLSAVALSRVGFVVSEAEDGEQGLERCAEERPDVVLCDVLMPRLDGFGFCMALRSSEDPPPVIMLTSLEDVESVERAFQLGAADFIVKPINWVLLPRRVSFVLRARYAMDELRSSEERYALAARGANDGLFDWDVVDDRVYYSPRWAELLGIDQILLGDSPDEWLSRIHPDEQERVRTRLLMHLSGESDHFEATFRVVRDDDSTRWMLARGIAVRNGHGEPTRLAGSMTDITVQVEALRQLEHDALHDPLTGLANRALFLDRMNRTLQARRRDDPPNFAVLFFDLDRFKLVNDTFGHLIGDKLLIEVGRRVKHELRGGDTLARLGGDEFAILLDNVHEVAEVTRVAERVKQSLARPVELEQQQILTSASIGITFGDQRYECADAVLRDADAALYQAKRCGRARYQLFDPEQHQEAMRKLQLEMDLRQAITRGELALDYQPILNLDTGTPVGVEALLRWHHPEQGCLAPSEFLSIAEQSGLIVSIGRWVMERACEQISVLRLQDDGWRDMFVSINVAAREFAEDDMVDFIASLLGRFGLPASSIRIELTESTLIENHTTALARMNALHDLGVRLAIDDFGTGYSSFNYLHRFPFDVLKIDRSFIDQIEESPRQIEIVRSIQRLASSLGLAVVAEGVESEACASVLKGLELEYAQGFHLGRPGGVEALAVALQRTLGDSIEATPEAALELAPAQEHSDV